MAEKEMTYEEKVQKLDEILTRLDNSETPIDKLSQLPHAKVQNNALITLVSSVVLFGAVANV